jgi:hypothetical protein
MGEGVPHVKLKADLFLVTYPGDHPWLPYLFFSIAKFVKQSSYRNLVIVLEKGDPKCQAIETAERELGAVVKRCQKYRGTAVPGYLGQQIEKLRAWKHTDAERIVVLDSDEVFCRPVDLQSDPAIKLERPLLIWRKWENAGKAACWRSTTREVLGWEPLGETLCRDPYVYPSAFLREAWKMLGGEKRLRGFANRPTNTGVSEFNLLGNIALKHHAWMFTLMEAKGHAIVDEMTCAAADPRLPRACIKRFWSHYGVSDPSVQRKMKELGLT